MRRKVYVLRTGTVTAVSAYLWYVTKLTVRSSCFLILGQAQVLCQARCVYPNSTVVQKRGFLCLGQDSSQTLILLYHIQAGSD